MMFLSLHFLVLFQGAADHVALWDLCSHLRILVHSNHSSNLIKKAKGGLPYVPLGT